MERPTLLLVDDEVFDLEVVAGILGSEYELLAARSGEDAIALAGSESVDLILLDVLMPGMSGFEVCHRLKSSARTQDIPILFVTSLDHPDDETKALEMGAIDFVSKPINHAVLRARVRNHVELKRSRDALKTLSLVDGLTGVANRRRFDEALQAEWRRATRVNHTLALVLADVDNFKAYNDSQGHVAGDEVLRSVARCLAMAAARPTDITARFGGEEFAIILPDTDLEGAHSVAERARHLVASLAIPHLKSDLGIVTISLGVAALKPLPQDRSDRLVLNADQALYKAKTLGRNQSFSATH